MFKSKKRKQHGYRESGLPFFLDQALNYVLKFTIGVTFFWLLYFPLYHSDELDAYSRMSFIMLYSIVSSGLALVSSFIILALNNKRKKNPRKGITDLNSWPDLSDILGELIAIVLNATVQMAGLLWTLNSQLGNTWWTFLGLYCVLKFITRVLSIFIAVIISKNAVVTAAFLVIFGSILAISISQIQKAVIYYVP